MSCITEILKIKGDKEVLAPLDENGKPWVIVEGGGTYKDHEYLIILNTVGHRCGYVAIPPDHKFNETKLEIREMMGSLRKYEHYDYDSLNIDCHGGLTFMDKNHSLKDLLTVPCDDFWIGFDCGHYNDSPDVAAYKKHWGEESYKQRESFFGCMDEGRENVRDFYYVEKECHKIIKQLIEVKNESDR